MGKKVLVVECSMRPRSNSDALAEQFARGAADAGNKVEVITLKDRGIRFCKGCLACQKTMKCVIKDDMAEFVEKVRTADAICFATPIYYYEMSGQMKTFLDRCNPLYVSDYHFRDIYMLCTASDDNPATPDRARNGLEGWIECFEKAQFAGSVFCGGVTDMGAIEGNASLKQAYFLGQSVK